MKEMDDKVEKSPIRNGGEFPFFLIFTDLDGTLLDHDSYRWDEAAKALALCKKTHVPVIMVSSKTRAEMEVLGRKLSLKDPFISENGGGIFVPDETFRSFEDQPSGGIKDGGFWKWTLGSPYLQLVKALHEIRVQLGWKLRGFSDMSVREISALTGLDLEASRLAARREFDEPFVILEPKAPERGQLQSAAAEKGLTVTLGGRFHHLHGKNDKGHAMKKVISWYKRNYNRVFTIALGDSPNDFPMLKGADFPVLIRSSKAFSDLQLEIPGLMVTGEMGPRGWSSAVLGILGRKEEIRNV